VIKLGILDVFRRKKSTKTTRKKRKRGTTRKRRTKTNYRAKPQKFEELAPKTHVTQPEQIQHVEPTKEEIFQYTEEVNLPETKQLLEEWEEQIKSLQDHPLSQVKIINTELLGALTRILRSIDKKLSDLEKLDSILELLEKSKEKIEKQGIFSPELNVAIERLASLTLKDKTMIDVLSQHDRLTAEEISEKIGVSRSTCSSRLNKLYMFGMVEKVPVGKKIYFKLKKKELDEKK